MNKKYIQMRFTWMMRKPDDRNRRATLPTAVEYSSADSEANSRQSVVIITSYDE